METFEVLIVAIEDHGIDTVSYILARLHALGRLAGDGRSGSGIKGFPISRDCHTACPIVMRAVVDFSDDQGFRCPVGDLLELHAGVGAQHALKRKSAVRVDGGILPS